MTEIITADIGGTHARFALATVTPGQPVRLDHIAVRLVADHATLAESWRDYVVSLDRIPPRNGAIAMAGSVAGQVLEFTNNPWQIDRATIADTLDLDRCLICNDFDAVGHAVAQGAPQDFAPLCGPGTWPDNGVTSIIGPGTGLGIASVLRLENGAYHVIPTEGGHLDFAPLDAFEDRLLARLRDTYDNRVSIERVVSGPGLKPIYETLAEQAGAETPGLDDRSLWQSALGGEDPLASRALERLCRSLGAVTGDIAIAQGASAVVIAGGLGARLAGHLPQSGFADRFIAKGRYRQHMQGLPVRLLVHPQPGLSGAAAAFMARYREESA
ncbi:MAG: glucokinase [Pseudomonadota bacterium]